MVKPNEIYRHYKKPDHLYKIIAVGKHSETLEDMVVYQALYKSDNFPMFQIWVRPLSMFEEIVNGNPRFERLYNIELDDEIFDKACNDIKNQEVDKEAVQKGVKHFNKHING